MRTQGQAADYFSIHSVQLPSWSFSAHSRSISGFSSFSTKVPALKPLGFRPALRLHRLQVSSMPCDVSPEEGPVGRLLFLLSMPFEFLLDMEERELALPS